jgi:sugar phosphate isomerase/epimerase
MWRKMKISIVTDEISADLETAIEIGTEWGIHDFELRGFGTQRVPLFSDFQKQRVRELLDEYGARVVAISPGLFKIPYPSKVRDHFPLQIIDSSLYEKWHDSRSLFDYHMQELLPASIEYAKEIGADKIVVFSFHKGSNLMDSVPDEVLESLSWAAQQAERSGLQLVIEVEDQFWADTGKHTAEIIRKINQPALGVNWDPGNAIVAGDIPYPNGYQEVRDFVRHVHFKDVFLLPHGGYRYEVQGQIDWVGQIQSLVADGYQGYISVEPHMQPKVASAKALLNRLQEMIELATNNE